MAKIIRDLIDLIKGAINFIKNLIKAIVTGLFNFLAHCVNWFKKLYLDKNKDVPFVANGEYFKQMLDTAPVKEVGIFQGVYDESIDEITHHVYVEADGLDAKTREVLGNEPIVVLS